MIEGFEAFSPQERAYLDSKGEKPIEDAPAVDEEATEEVENEAETDEAVEVEAEDESEAEDEEAKEEPKPKPKDQRIPLRKLREEEDRRKAVERERDTIKEQFARADERLRLLFNAQQREQTREPPPPDKNQDPIGFMEWQQSQIERLEQGQRAQQEQHQRQSQIGQIDNAYKQSWSTFASKTPDALDAYQHFVNVTAGYLEMQGVPAEQINQLVENEERKITVAAMQRRVSPAELIYEKAKAFGFQPKPAAKPAADNEAAKKADEDIERRQKAQSASKSLSSAGGSRGGQSITAAELASMSDDEFEEVRSKLGERALRKLMGE